MTIEPVNIYQTLEQHSSDVTQEMLSQGEDPFYGRRIYQGADGKHAKSH